MLNDKQQEAVRTTEGPLMILAGAGAGKTKTIVERIVHIIKLGVEPRNILAVTFTNKAAKEMRERVLHRLQEEGILENWEADMYRPGKTPMIKTFHSLGMCLLQEEYERARLTKRLTIYDEGDSLGLIKEICEELGVDPKVHEPKKMKGIISRLKGDMVELSDYAAQAISPFQKVTASVWEKYERKLQEKKIVDFDDLIAKSVRLLEEHEDIRHKYQNLWQYVHIDEYQDTNNSQYRLSKLLVNKQQNICVVGDIDQNIYSWRGANLRNLLKFEDDYPDTILIKLEENYRSTQNILTAANEIIKLNTVRKEKNLFTKNGQGELITVVESSNDKLEAQYIVEEVAKLKLVHVKGGDITVLYRNNFQSRVIEQEFISAGISYHLLGIKFFDRKEVKDVLSYLKLTFNPESSEDLKRALSTPSRGFGKVAMTKILSNQEESLNAGQREKLQKFRELISELRDGVDEKYPSDIITTIVKKSGLEESLKEEGTEEAMERLANIYELVALASEYDKYEIGEAMEKFLEESALVSDQDTDTGEEDKVRMMTIHASKGLEFKYVFIVGLEDGLFPSNKKETQKLSKEEEEEERRLFYVAITRAREKLYLTYARERMLFGKKEWHERSEFIDNVPDELIEVVKKEYPFGGRDDFGGGYGKFGGGYRKFGSKTFGGGAPIGAQQSDNFGFGKSKWNDDEDDVVYI
jgi:DNA helicase-2/ATP-dependent DNA helicase PcrA